MRDRMPRQLPPVTSGRHFVAVGRKTRAMARLGQPTTLAAAQAEADSMRIQGFDRFAVYELVEVKR